MEYTDVWDFVEQHYPDYSRCENITRSDDLQKIVDGELNGSARTIFNEDFNIYAKPNIPTDRYLNEEDRKEYGLEMAEAQAELESLNSDIFKRAIEGFIKESENRIDANWGIVDIVDLYANDNEGAVLSDADALEIATRVKRYHDATIGINWDVIRTHTLDYFQDKV